MINLKQKITPTLIQSVLQFIKPFASKTLAAAIKRLLEPCCTANLTDADVECDDSDNYTVTITVSNPVAFATEARLIVNDAVVSTIDNPSGNTLVFENAEFASGSVQFNVEYLIHTNFDKTIGVIVGSNTIAATAPVC